MGLNKYYVIARDLQETPQGFFRGLAEKIKEIITGPSMTIIRGEMRSITDNATEDVLDVRGKKVASVKSRNGILGIRLEKDTLVSFDTFKDIPAGRVEDFVRTEGNFVLKSRSRNTETTITGLTMSTAISVDSLLIITTIK